jgi:Trk K+ transport system NAD-binding subunit
MKFNMKRQLIFPQQPLYLLQRITSRRNAMLLSRLFFALVFVLVLYSSIFHYLMDLEGQKHSIISGFYWTVSTMGTLGLGAVAFTSDIGKLYTILVNCTGIFFLLVLFPFTLIKLFQSSARIPRELPKGTRGHVVLTEYNPLTSALVERLQRYNQPYAVLVPDLEEAIRLREQGIKSVAGELDDPDTFREIRVEHAAFLVATGSDISNTSLAYTVRHVSENIPIIASASGGPAVHILQQAGCTHVLALDEMMGQSLARRIIAGDAMAHIIGQIDDMVIAEAAAAGTPIVGKTIEQVQALHIVDASIVGIWEDGIFSLPSHSTRISGKSILVIAGLQNHIDRYNELFCIYNISSAPILIIGGGSVGRALVQALKDRDIDFRIIEKSRALILDDKRYIHGDAIDIHTLERSGFFQAPAVAVTTHSDPINIYITTYLRHLRKNIQIISRATLDRNIQTLHSAGCDFVISHASLGANNIFNLSKRGSILMIAEGVDVFRVKTPKALIGKTIEYASIREECGCSVIGISANGSLMINPNPEATLPQGGEIILIGCVESEEKFFKRYRPVTVEQ